MRRITISFILLVSLISCKNKNVGKVAEFYPCEEKLFWKVVCHAESGCKTDTWMKEPLNPATVSAGLYQLSMGAASQYGCDFKEFKDILNPQKNESCKDKIVSKLRSMYPTLSWDMALGKYWGVMRKKEKWPEYHAAIEKATGKPHTGYKNLQYYGTKFGCIIP
jgi:hypothetical protein